MGKWKARNDDVWNNKFFRAITAVFTASAYLSQWKSVQRMGVDCPIGSVVTSETNERWMKPRTICVKVNYDAAIFKESSKYGVGRIAIDANGIMIKSAPKCFSGRIILQRRSEYRRKNVG